MVNLTPSFDVTPEAARHGWKDRPDEVDRIVSSMRYPVAGLAMERSFLATEHRDVFLWEQGEIPLFGKTLPAHRQTIGDCVSHGWGRAIQDLVFIDMARAGQDGASAVEIATEPIYGFSRVEIGRGQLGNGDGSVGAWAAEAELRYGNLVRKRYSNLDLSVYSGQIAKQLGSPRSGVPDSLEPEAATHVVKLAPLVASDDEAMSALYNLYPIPVCSGQGFTEVRDQFGFCDPKGSWAHCMYARGIAYLFRNGRKILSVIIQQSWGESPTGPNKITVHATGREVTLPQGCFAVEFDVFVNRMLKQRDSFAPSGPQGFVRRVPLFDLL